MAVGTHSSQHTIAITSNTTFPALQNIQTGLNQAKHSKETAAISFNANIMMADNSRPP
jgi:hypothetical protein